MKDVADPLAGSYYVEWLTAKMEEEAWKIFNKLEEQGGYQEGLANGSIKTAIDNSAYETKQKIKTGKQPMVGLNRYQTNEKENYEPFRVDYELERKAIERLNAFKAKRNEKEAESAIKHLKNCCADFKEGKSELMPALIHAAKNYVTNGEMMDVMRDAFGWYVTE